MPSLSLLSANKVVEGKVLGVREGRLLEDNGSHRGRCGAAEGMLVAGVPRSCLQMASVSPRAACPPL